MQKSTLKTAALSLIALAAVAIWTTDANAGRWRRHHHHNCGGYYNSGCGGCYGATDACGAQSPCGGQSACGACGASTFAPGQQPVVDQQMNGQPGYAQPGYGQSGNAQPMYNQQGQIINGQPAPYRAARPTYGADANMNQQVNPQIRTDLNQQQLNQPQNQVQPLNQQLNQPARTDAGANVQTPAGDAGINVNSNLNQGNR